jgi:hypothetical protein
VLALQNHVNLSNLSTIRSLNAGSLTVRAWETLRAAVQGGAITRAASPVSNLADIRSRAHNLPRMRPGAERC